MILVDANVWIAHLDRGEPALADMLGRHEALVHPYTIGEIALGGLAESDLALSQLARLQHIVMARHAEVMRLIAIRQITGIGYVDAHLIASVLLVPGVLIWTRDKRLRRVAERLAVLAPLA